VSWTPPASDGGSPVTSYEVVAQPGGQTCTWTSGLTRCTVAGLDNGVSYTFRVTATTAEGVSTPSAPSAPVAPRGPACGPLLPGPFTDVGGDHLFCEAIDWLAQSGITTGLPDGRFEPTAPVSRQAMAAFLYRFAGEPGLNRPTPFFSDVDPGHQFYEPIQWMGETGIAQGWMGPPEERPLFGPTESVSRQSMAAFLHRLAADPPVTATAPYFADVLSGPFYEPIQWMAEAELSLGTPNPDGGLPLFVPRLVVSRQVMAAFLHRYAPIVDAS
jgi:hypothetical protein